MKDLMFVCTGNTCRSPMAEGIAKKIYKNIECTIISRGIAVMGEGSVNRKAVLAMNSKGIDITNHKSKQFDPTDISDNMLILTMTSRHKGYLLEHYKGLEDKIYTILEYIGEAGDVYDPFGLEQVVYNQCAEQLEKAVSKIKGHN